MQTIRTILPLSGKKKKPEPKNWILTAYSKVSSDVTSAPPDIN